MSVARSLCTLLFLCCILTVGCSKRHVQIDRDTRRMIDTIASRKFTALRPLMDSTCQGKMDSLVSVMTDSVLLERREEMRKLLRK